EDRATVVPERPGHAVDQPGRPKPATAAADARRPARRGAEAGAGDATHGVGEMMAAKKPRGCNPWALLHPCPWGFPQGVGVASDLPTLLSHASQEARLVSSRPWRAARISSRRCRVASVSFKTE